MHAGVLVRLSGLKKPSPQHGLEAVLTHGSNGDDVRGVTDILGSGLGTAF
jgi:hypothetical protein